MSLRNFCFMVAVLIAASAAQSHPVDGWPVVMDERALGPNLRARMSVAPAEVLTLLLADAGLPANEVKIEIIQGYRVITSNGIPDHETGRFPNRNNPNAIRPQRQVLRVPVEPKPAAKPIPLPSQAFGVAINGVLFDPGTAEYWQNDPGKNWRMEALNGPRHLGLDAQMAHVQPNGAYHYHALPPALFPDAKAGPGGGTMQLIGWAADGYPIYGPLAYVKADDAASGVRAMKSSYRLKKEERPGGNEGPGGKPDGGYTRDWEYVAGSGDLDECNGRTGVTPEFPNGTYYYVVTNDWPYIPRMFHGTPDPSFERRGPGPGGAGRGPGGRPGGPPFDGGRRPPPPPPGRRPPPPR